MVETKRKLEDDLSTRTPCWFTEAGSLGAARDRRFCTSTCARSGLVPGLKLMDICPVPLAWLVDSI